MPARLSLDEAYDRLFDSMPDWQTDLSKPEWIRRWMQATGDSRATAYRMQDHALEIDDTLWRVWVANHGGQPTEDLFLAYCDFWGVPRPSWGIAA